MNIPDVFVGEIMASDEPGFACSKAKLVDEGLIHLRPFNISNCGALFFKELYHVPIDQAPTGKRRLEPGDLLFNNTNSVELVGKAALVEESIEAGYSNHLTRIRVNQEKVYPLFMLYWLRWMRGTGYFSAHATQWVSQAAFKSSELRRLKMPLPELPEQRRIVDILSRAEGIVRLRREAEKKAAEVIPALFIDMFGDPATNPKGWRIISFGEFGSCRLGKMLDKKMQTGQFKKRYLRNVNVQWDRIDTHDLLEMDFRQDEQGTFRLEKGDVLICEGGDIGRAAIWDAQIEECYFQKALHRLRPDKGVVSADFVVWLLWQLAKSEAFAGSKTHATIAHLTGVQLKNLRVICPPLEDQMEFETRVREFHAIQRQQANALSKAEETFNALLSSAFSSTGTTS